MIKPIFEAVRAIADAMAAEVGARPMATDAEVVARFRELARWGFVPADQWIEPLRAYLSGYGVMLSGDTGVGKTFFFRHVHPGGRLRPVEEILDYGLRDIKNWYEWTDGKDIVIDDLGVESVTVEYGTREDLLKTVIAHRAERQTGRTSITTNLSAEEISERYGDRTLSRILGMCKAFRIGGESMRTATPIS